MATHLIDRESELYTLNQQLAGSSSRRKSAFIMLYGRRRVGKSTLLEAWAEGSGREFTFWKSDKDLAEVQRRDFYAKFMAEPRTQVPRFESWTSLFDQMAAVIGDKPHILIIDEVTYAAQSDDNFYAALQHAWDKHFQNSAVTLVICGSHVRAMNDLFREGSPLFGRFTMPIYLEPMSFAQLRKFFPKWSAEERVAAYAMVGGIPAYFEWLEPNLSLQDNLRTKVIAKPGPFLVEGRFLIYDALEQPAAHISVLKAIGEGRHAFDEIRLASEGASNKLSTYLDRLRELRLVDRVVSALVPPSKRKASKSSRWMLADPFLRFYYRFIAPALDADVYDPVELTQSIWTQLRGFVGRTAFEEICREWVRQSATRPGVLPMRPVVVGRHWSRTVEADVIAINWEEKSLLIGECKWDDDLVTREQARKLVEETKPKVMADLQRQLSNPLTEISQWQVHLAYFARRGYTAEARRYLATESVLAVDLKRLDTEIV